MKPLCRATTILGLSLLGFLLLAGCSGNGGEPDAGQDVPDANGGDEGPPPCTTLADCPSRHLCVGGICEEGTVCGSDDDCGAGYICNVIKEVCVPENPCQGDEDCTDTPATPFCMVSSGLCVACLADSDCTGTPPTPHCSNLGTCVMCTSDAHCPQGQVCNDAHVCEDEAPDCTDDGDCASPTPHCDTSAGKCYACVGDQHCTGGFVCEPTTHRCVECFQDVHCLGADKCKPTTFTCVECLQDTDCSGGQHCNQSSNECTAVICTTDNDCTNEPGRPKCNVSSGDCVECLGHDDCLGTYVWCREYSCQSGCTTDEECEYKVGANYHCETVSGDCFYAECLDDGDCAGNAEKPHCKTSASPSNPPQYSCVECVEDDHCDEYFECSPTAFTCRPMPCYRYPQPDEKCQEFDACFYCNMGSGQCEPAYNCTYPAGPECCPGYTCNTMGHCALDLDCSAADPVCATGYECNTVTNQCEWVSCCQPPCGSGEYCDSQCVCQSGCHDQGDPCDPFSSNCCEGLLCNPFWPICTSM